MIYYAPTSKLSTLLQPLQFITPPVFGQLGLNPNTTSLLATGVFGIVNVSHVSDSGHTFEC